MSSNIADRSGWSGSCRLLLTKNPVCFSVAQVAGVRVVSFERIPRPQETVGPIDRGPTICDDSSVRCAWNITRLRHRLGPDTRCSPSANPRLRWPEIATMHQASMWTPGKADAAPMDAGVYIGYKLLSLMLRHLLRYDHCFSEGGDGL